VFVILVDRANSDDLGCGHTGIECVGLTRARCIQLVVKIYLRMSDRWSAMTCDNFTSF
jgi:hypothetical protein